MMNKDQRVAYEGRKGNDMNTGCVMNESQKVMKVT